MGYLEQYRTYYRFTYFLPQHFSYQTVLKGSTYSPNLPADDSIPIVTIDRHFGGSVPCVCSDNYRGGEMAAEKLTEALMKDGGEP